MQPTSNQFVPAATFVPSQLADRQPSGLLSAPMPLSAEVLRQIGGGGGGPSTDAPNGSW